MAKGRNAWFAERRILVDGPSRGIECDGLVAEMTILHMDITDIYNMGDMVETTVIG